MMTARVTAECDDYPPLSALNHLHFLRAALRAAARSKECGSKTPTPLGGLSTTAAYTHLANARVGRSASIRGLRLASHRLRLTGVADLVEFREAGPLSGEIPYPVEYKRGRRRRWDNDEVQLCAQAICLEEMLGVDRSLLARFTTSRAGPAARSSSLQNLGTKPRPPLPGSTTCLPAAVRPHPSSNHDAVAARSGAYVCPRCSATLIAFDGLTARLFQAALSDPPPTR